MANTQPLKLINIARRYKKIRPVPRMPNFATWIEGVDLTQLLSAPVQAELRQALFDFEVIFFEPQTLTPPQHVALAKVCGPLSTGSYFERKPGAPEMEMIVSDREHPPAGGNTCWVSTSKAYDWLSPGMKKYLEGLNAVHSWEVSAFREALGQRGDDALIGARAPERAPRPTPCVARPACRARLRGRRASADNRRLAPAPSCPKARIESCPSSRR